MARDDVRPLDAVLHRVVGGLVAQTGHLICAKNAEEPNRARDRNGVGVEQIEQVLALGAVRDTFSELVERHGGICEVREPGLPLCVVWSDPLGDAEGGWPTRSVVLQFRRSRSVER